MRHLALPSGPELAETNQKKAGREARALAPSRCCDRARVPGETNEGRSGLDTWSLDRNQRSAALGPPALVQVALVDRGCPWCHVGPRRARGDDRGSHGTRPHAPGNLAPERGGGGAYGIGLSRRQRGRRTPLLVSHRSAGSPTLVSD